MPEPVMSAADKAEAVVRYQGGASTTQLATRFRVSTATINRLLPEELKRARGWSPRDDVATAEIVRLRDEEGLTWAQIADRVGMHLTGARKRYLRATACRGVNTAASR